MVYFRIALVFRLIFCLFLVRMSPREFSTTLRRTSSIRHGRQRTLDLVRGRDTVPALWLTPESDRPTPAVLLLHGFSSSKERMAQSVGRALLERGVASLALDLPFHGAREMGELPKNPLALVGAWKAAVSESRGAIAWLAAQPEVDPARLGVVGYSLGGFLALMTAAEEERLRVVALVAAGDLPDRTPYAALVRGLVDPPRAARRLDGRPLLLVNGRRDMTTRAAQAERLFEAASEPKTMVWYDGGHWPPQSAIDQAAEWTAARLLESKARARQAG
jgi:dienelactone hydrolase